MRYAEVCALAFDYTLSCTYCYLDSLLKKVATRTGDCGINIRHRFNGVFTPRSALDDL